jgi:sterol 3beta-glucosyltransferase
MRRGSSRRLLDREQAMHYLGMPINNCLGVRTAAMRITIFCVGSRGDVQPYIALGSGLLRAGHEVTIGTHTNFQEMVETNRLHFSPVEGNIREILQTEEGRKWIEADSNPFSFFAGLIRLTLSRFGVLTRDAWEACKNAEAIVYSPLGLCCHSIAEKLKIPACMAPVQPVSPTTIFASPMFPPVALGKLYNVTTHKAASQIVWQPFRNAFNRWRKEILDLPPYSFWGPLTQIRKRNEPVINGFSQSILPRPADWRSECYVTGYWFLDRENGWEPPQDLLQFLSAGQPPVYIGFGSMSERDPKGLSQILVRALQLAKQRGILLSGWAELPKEDLPENVFVIDSLPHDWLFPRTAAVVHHGGAGTTAAVFRAGVPNVVVPFFGDQHFWGHQVFKLGAGPKPISRKRLTAEGLAHAITQAVSDANLQRQAEKLGERIRSEDGVSRAVEILETKILRS